MNTQKESLEARQQVEDIANRIVQVRDIIDGFAEDVNGSNAPYGAMALCDSANEMCSDLVVAIGELETDDKIA